MLHSLNFNHDWIHTFIIQVNVSNIRDTKILHEYFIIFLNLPTLASGEMLKRRKQLYIFEQYIL